MRAFVILFALLLANPAEAATPVFNTTIAGDVSESGAVFFNGFVKRAVEAGAEQLWVDIDSEGGDARAAVAMVRAVRTSGLKVTCTVRGVAHSAAFYFLQAACDRRIATSRSQLGTHRPYGMFRGPVGQPLILTVERAEEVHRSLSALAAVVDGAIASRLGLSPADYRKRVADGSTWLMTAEEAVVFKAIDQVIP